MSEPPIETGSFFAEGDPDIETHLIARNGSFPNNSTLPVIYYRQAVFCDRENPSQSMEDRFEANGWGYSWRNGIFPYQHYHSTAHEVLGIAAGSARIQLGGEGGIEIEMQAGDAIVIPAGVALKNLESSQDLIAVGSYPPGQLWDVNTGEDDERARTEANIANLPLPVTDPLFGPNGPLMSAWHSVAD
ncbi:MAG: hypothetical protein ACR2OU_12425 [Thermomicrobiales bacterium]